VNQHKETPPVLDPQKLWSLRPFEDADRDFVIYTFLASSRYSPDAIAMGAHRDEDARRRHWLGAERLIQRLVDKTEITVAEAISDGSRIIVGWACGESDAVLHYILTRRKFQRMGVATDLINPWMHGKTVYYSFRPSVRGLEVPKSFKYDPYACLKWME
jgi:hypothetical protein